MSATLYYIVGTSDVCINNRTRVPNYYELCEALFRAVENSETLQAEGGKLKLPQPVEAVIEDNGNERRTETVGELTFPLLEPLLRQTTPRPNRIVFFATRQQPPFATDTYWAARLLEEYLKQSMKDCRVVINEIPVDPSDHDKMMTFFTDYRINRIEEMKYSLNNYFYLSPGTPAAVTAFSLAVSDLDFAYFYLPRGSREVKRVAAFSNFIRQKHRDALSDLLRKFDFKGALALAENSVYRNDQKLLAWLKALNLRFDFNYREAIDVAKHFKEDKELFGSFVPISDIIVDQDRAAYAGEMIARIEIEFEQGRSYLGLVFLFNLLENVRAELLSRNLNIKLNEKQNGGFSQWDKYIDDCPWINENEKENFKKYGPSRINTMKLLKKYNDNEAHDDRLTRILQFLDKLENVKVDRKPFEGLSLQDLRNRGPAAHGMFGPGENLLDKMWQPYGAKGFFDELASFYRTVFDKPLGKNHLKTLIDITENMLEHALEAP